MDRFRQIHPRQSQESKRDFGISTLGMQTMNASLDSLLAEAVISEGVYEDVMKNYASFA